MTSTVQRDDERWKPVATASLGTVNHRAILLSELPKVVMGGGLLNNDLRGTLQSRHLYRETESLCATARSFDVIVIDEPYFYYTRGGNKKSAGLYQSEMQRLNMVLLQANPNLHILVGLGVAFAWFVFSTDY